MDRCINSVKDLISCALITTCLCLSTSLKGQIPQRAIELADSICQTRLICPNATVKLQDSIYYPILKTEYFCRQSVSFLFIYDIQLNPDLITSLNISISHDFQIKNVNGAPDTNNPNSPCDILSREELWLIAKQHGLKTKFKNCRYSVNFEKENITLQFYEKRSRYDLDFYVIDALTGEFYDHRQMNVNF